MATAQGGGVAATVVITTKNRKEELREAIRSALAQDVRVEVLVIDDASTDGTSEMVRAEFPAVTLETATQSRGYIVQRNRGAEFAHGSIIFSIDDDAAFSSPQTVRQTLVEFDYSRIGAVAIPFINVNQDQIVRQRPIEAGGVFVAASFIGTAHALRRDVFQKLGGYRPFLFHQGEESDFCIRMLDAGYVVRVGRADPIHHSESPRRDNRRIVHFGRRNDVLFAWQNVPMPYLIPHMAATTFKGVFFGIKMKRVGSDLIGLGKGFAACFHELRHRHPVRREVYRLSREMRRRGMMPLAEVEGRLSHAPPPLTAV